MNSKGIGLGLAIAKQIVSQFNGNITLESNEGYGSSFTFTFELEFERVGTATFIDSQKQ